MADQLKLAFIGCGGIVAQHLDMGLKHFEDVEFVGFCDLNADAAEARKQQVGGQGKVFQNASQMIQQTKPDAIYIMLPPFAHGPIESLVLEHKLPFFVEKPVAIDMDTAKRVYDGVVQRDLITSVGYMNRYRNGVQRAKSILETQTPVFLHGGWVGLGPEKYPGTWKWWVQKDKSGGQFLEQATHITDLARYFFGDVQEVYAVAVTDRKERPDLFTIEDAAMVQLRFANGAAGNIYCSCSTDPGSGVSLEVHSTQMYAKFDGWIHNTTIKLPKDETVIIPGEDNIFAKEDRAFVDAVITGDSSGILATYEDGLKAIAIACAADESMRTGKAIKLNV